MRNRKLLILALAPTLLLAGCGGSRGLESAHQPVVSRTDYVFDVAVSGNRLAPGEGQRLAGWMASLNLAYGDHVAIDDPAGGASGVREDVAAQAAHYGLLVSDDAPVTGAPVAPGTVRVVVSRMKATVPGCPDFTRLTQPNFDSATSANHGCAINSNLAAMIANPVDLVRGQPGAPITDQQTATKAITTFRKAAPGGAAAK